MNQESYHFQLGHFDGLIVLDSTHSYPKPKEALFSNAPQEQLEEVLGQHNLEQWDEYISPYPVVFINTGEHKKK